MKGTHGTTCSRGHDILVNGFQSGDGIRGNGVYFWGYLAEPAKIDARQLAISWWQYKHKKGDYSKDANSACLILYCGFTVSDGEFFDFERQEVREKFTAFWKMLVQRMSMKDNLENLSYAYNMFMSECEITNKKPYKLVRVSVPRPNNTNLPCSLDIMGQPSCYVVKDKGCIEISKHEELKK